MPTAHAASREIELKLELAPDRIDDLRCHPVFREAVPVPDRSGHLRAVYFDTPTHALRRAGLSLRVRERDGLRVQTVKAERAGHGIALDRGEWECPVGNGPDLEAAAHTPLAKLLHDETIRSQIQPAFTVETDRQVFDIERDGSLVEISLDRADVTSGGRSVRFAEAELELKQGEPSALFALAGELEGAVPLRLSTITKSERGYGLLREENAEAVRAGPVEVRPGMTSAEAFQVIARSCLAQIVQNEALVRRTRDPEALHQMRVGLRRLNAARSLFKPMLRNRQADDLKADLRWMGRKLGRVRDLDVFANRLRPAGSSADDGALREVEEHRSDAYASLLRTLEKRRFMTTILRIAAWIETGEWLHDRKKRARAARCEPVEDRARAELKRRWKRIRKRSRSITDLTEKQRHRLRMRIKTLRYGMEFFAATFPGREAGKRRRALLAIFQRLQDDLGEMNDLSVATDLVPSHANGALGDFGGRFDKLLSRAEASARNLRKARPFWARAIQAG